MARSKAWSAFFEAAVAGEDVVGHKSAPHLNRCWGCGAMGSWKSNEPLVIGPKHVKQLKLSVAMRFGLEGKHVPKELKPKIQTYVDGYVLYDHVLNEGESPSVWKPWG